jgi:hypothetical protein
MCVCMCVCVYVCVCVCVYVYVVAYILMCALFINLMILYIPDPKFDTTLTLDGRKVVVPQGTVIDRPEYEDSDFDQSEYLVYKESQVRMRFMFEMTM